MTTKDKQTKPKEKPVLLELDNGKLRISRWDDNNVFIEREETYWNTREKSNVTKFVFRGYYASVFRALESIHSRGLLIDEGNIKSVNDLVKQLNQSKKEIFKAVKLAKEIK